MTCFWMSVILFLIQPTPTSSDEGVTIHCNNSFEVLRGDSLTIPFCLNWHLEKCSCENYTWTRKSKNTSRSENCTQYSNEPLHVTISEVTFEENITLSVTSTCGMDEKEVQILPYEIAQPMKPGLEPQSDNHSLVIAITLSVLAAVISIAVVCFVKNKCRARRRHNSYHTSVSIQNDHLANNA